MEARTGKRAGAPDSRSEVGMAQPSRPPRCSRAAQTPSPKGQAHGRPRSATRMPPTHVSGTGACCPRPRARAPDDTLTRAACVLGAPSPAWEPHGPRRRGGLSRFRQVLPVLRNTPPSGARRPPRCCLPRGRRSGRQTLARRRAAPPPFAQGHALPTLQVKNQAQTRN